MRNCLKLTTDHSAEILQEEDGATRFNSYRKFTLESGQYLSELSLVFETWGTLNADNSNVILIHHALSVGSHASATKANSNKGWWQDMIGKGKAIDTSKYYVICINNLGSCLGSTGPRSINPETKALYGYDFPQVTIGDMVRSQKLLMEYLNIEKLYAVIGSSKGSMLSLTWGIEYPNSLAHLVLISGSYKAYPANIANRNIQHQAIKMDPMWNGGCYRADQDLSGFKLARKLGLYTYRNSTEWNRRFNSHNNDISADSDIVDYMDYNAEKFSRSFDANSYLILTSAMDLFDVTKNYSSLQACFSNIKARTLVVSVDSDILFTPQQQQELFAGLKAGGVDSAYINHASSYGHDAFLVETEPFTGYISDFFSQGERGGNVVALSSACA